MLNYLEREENKNKEKIQIFITSHSADFASIANIDSLCCIHENNKEIKVFYPREVVFEKGIKEKLQRYLDITRAALFFARKIILVEGTGELFMISALAERLNKDLKKNSVSLLSTEGINFNCFIPLFGKDALNIPIVIISDADPKGNKFPNIGDNLDPSTTAKKLQSTENKFIKVFLAQKTLEYDLALHVNNHQIMLDVYKSRPDETDYLKK